MGRCNGDRKHHWVAAEWIVWDVQHFVMCAQDTACMVGEWRECEENGLPCLGLVLSYMNICNIPIM